MQDVLELQVPGPGVWRRDEMHFPRPVPRSYIEVFNDAAIEGFREFSARYGLLIDTFESRFVDGFGYGTFRMVGEPAKPSRRAGAPPAPVMWLLSRLHPAMRARTKAARAALEQRLWMHDLHRWQREARPATFAANRALQAVDRTTLNDEELLAFAARCRDHLRAMITQHHRFNGPALLPSALLHLLVVDETGEPAAANGLLTGSSPVSSGRSSELADLAAAIRASARARHALDDADPVAALARLREELRERYDSFIDLVGHRIVGDSIEISNPTFLEQPRLLLDAIRSAVEQLDASPADAWVGQQIASVRARIPSARREEFDRLLLEARECNPVRDERSVYGDVWATGIYRTVLIEAGRRAVQAGRLEAPEHMIDAESSEVEALVRGTPDAPSARDMAARTRFRLEHATARTPQWLGGGPLEMPSLDPLPRPLRTVNAAVVAGVEAMHYDGEIPSDPGIVRGLPASPGSYEGTARVIAGPHQFDRIARGDVLVARTTSEAFNVVLPLLGAIVTDRGGQLSHAAIVSRECGIPCVVGTSDATQLIRDGARVLVDGSAGEVKVLG